jgi:hypothetical protein
LAARVAVVDYAASLLVSEYMDGPLIEHGRIIYGHLLSCPLSHEDCMHFIKKIIYPAEITLMRWSEYYEIGTAHTSPLHEETVTSC